MNLRPVAAIAAALLVAAGCSKPPTSGYVTSKQHQAAYDWVQMVCASYNSQGICTVQTPIVHHEPATWRLCLRTVDGEHSGCRDVPADVWARYEVGQHYPDPR